MNRWAIEMRSFSFNLCEFLRLVSQICWFFVIFFWLAILSRFFSHTCSLTCKIQIIVSGLSFQSPEDFAPYSEDQETNSAIFVGILMGKWFSFHWYNFFVASQRQGACRSRSKFRIANCRIPNYFNIQTVSTLQSNAEKSCIKSFHYVRCVLKVFPLL